MGDRTVETLTFGYGLIEGPCVDADGLLYFSDVPNGGVRALHPDGRVEVVVPKRRGVGGIAVHADGGLVLSGRNVCHVVDGETRIVFDPEDASLNDLTTDDQGRVICGTLRTDPFDDSSIGPPGEAYRIGLDGTVEELYGEVYLTNGIAFSPDGSVAYHADSVKGHLICHDVIDDRFRNRRALAPVESFAPDGLAVDAAGTIWVADYRAGCVRAIEPERGTEVDRVDVPAQAVTSVCFAGADRRDLIVVTADNTDDPARKGTVFRARVETPGLPVPLARV